MDGLVGSEEQGDGRADPQGEGRRADRKTERVSSSRPRRGQALRGVAEGVRA